MTLQLHTTGISGPNGETIYGGEAAGFVIHTADGRIYLEEWNDLITCLCLSPLLSLEHHIYHCGDTGVFGDMKVIDDIYTPDICLLCIGDFYTMGPKEAAYALNNV